MKKRILAAAAAGAVILSASGGVTAEAAFDGTERETVFSLYAGSTEFAVNGEPHTMSGEAFVRNGAIYLPADALLPYAGYAMGWDPDVGALTASDEDSTSYIYTSGNIVTLRGTDITFEHPMVTYENVLYMPITVFAAFTGDALYIDGELPVRNTGLRDTELADTFVTDEYRLGGSVQKYGSIYLINGAHAMEQLSYANTNGQYYAGVVNAVAASLPEVQVYDILIPSMSEFYGPKSVYSDQVSGIRQIYRQLDESVIPINIVKPMWEHAGEKLYFSTDHHWTQRGAYYAYRAFMENKGETVPELDAFPREDHYPFIGSYSGYLKGTAGAAQIRSHPETLERFMPITEYTGANYHDMYLQNKISNAQVINTKDNSYCTFVNGDQPLSHFITSVKNGKKLVIVKESFGDAFATWAVNNYEEVFVLDPRKWNGFAGNYQRFNLREFYDNVCRFDDLVIISYPGSTTSSLRQAILNLTK